MDEDHLMNIIEITKLIDLNKQIVKQENEVESDGDDVLPEVADPDTVMEELTGGVGCDRWWWMTTIGCDGGVAVVGCDGGGRWVGESVNLLKCPSILYLNRLICFEMDGSAYSVELVLKIWRKKIDESQLSSGSKDLFRTMEEDTLRYSGHARIAMVSDSSEENLNKRRQEAFAPDNYDEDQMEKLRKIQDATTRPQNNDTVLFLEHLEKYKDDYMKMLTKMQQDVSTNFDFFLEKLRNMQERKEENQNPGKSSAHEDLYRLMEKEEARLMEEEACHFDYEQTAIISSLKRLSKMLPEAACGVNEQQLKTMTKMQQDLESLRKRLDEAISSYYAQHPNQPKMLTKMQQDATRCVYCF
ncbi:hypothetical protein Tco_0089934 [Tanacetum coccineum]